MGSMARFALAVSVQRFTGWLFPIGTITVNVLGCLGIGFFSTRFETTLVAPHYRLALLVGAFGGRSEEHTSELQSH